MTANDITQQLPFSKQPEFAVPERIEYQGKPVMTTEQLAHAYGVDAVRIRQGFVRNPDRFEEGYHFFRLVGAALKDFKNRVSVSDAVGAKAKEAILWTEAGALRHAKILESPKAWEVFGKLEDAYFAVRSGAALPPPADERPQVDRIREGRLSYQHHLRICRMLGITGMPAHLAASRAVKNLLGIDPLAAMQITHAEAPDDAANVNTTTMGKQIGLSAQATNAALSRFGYQTSFRDAKGKLVYEPTAKGRALGGRMMDTGKKHGNGTPVTQLLWSTKTVEALKADLQMEKA